MARLWSGIALIGLTAALLGGTAATAAAQPGGTNTWYVQSGAPADGDGSAQHPFGSLAAVQARSRPYDTILVLPSPAGTPPLDGGIALLTGQRLIGVPGPGGTSAPRITNASLTGNNGDAVELADNTAVAHIVIAGSARGGIYGKNVTGVTITGNDVSGQNTSCTNGFFVLPFAAPTNTPGVGVAVPPPGLSNGWAAIMVDDDHGSQTVSISDNYVHDGVCGDGIGIRADGTGSITGTVSGNDVTRIPQGPGLRSVLAIGMQAQADSRLRVDVDYNTETDIGSTGADCEGIFANLNGTSRLTETISHNTFRHGIGGASCNGLENILSSGAATSHLSITDSSFTDDPGDMFEEANLGANARMTMDISNTTIAHTTIAGGNNGPIPFNIGECLTATAAGPGDRVSLWVTHSVISDCNNALSFGSNVLSQNGTGSAGLMDVDVSHSVLSQAKHDDLFWHNLTTIDALRIKVDRSVIAQAGEAGVVLRQEPSAATGTADVHINRDNVVGNPVQLQANAYQIDAMNDWWGSPQGSAAGSVQVTPPASVHDTPVLTQPAK